MTRRNRKLRKAMLLTCCALALVAISVGATLAYLTDTEAVTNTFTVGKVGISLDEAKTDTDGNKLFDKDGKEIRISGNRSDNEQYTNQYHLIPGQTYTKDPTVHVDADSEDCWIFVKVENGIADIEYGEPGGTKTRIDKQIQNNGWTSMAIEPGVYYRQYKKNDPNRDFKVFESFTLKGDGLVNGERPEDYEGPNEFIGDYAGATVKVTAYAIQMAGFESNRVELKNAIDAWDAGQFQ